MMGFGGPALHNGLAFGQYFKWLVELSNGSSAPTIFVMAWYRGTLLAAFGMLTVLSVYARARRWSPRAIRRLLIVGGVVWVLSIGGYVWRGVR